MRTPVKFDAAPPEAPKPSARRLTVKEAHAPLVLLLWADYVAHRARCSAVQKRSETNYMREMKPSDERLRLLATMAAWCAENKVEPRLWLYLLFRQRRWFWPPKLVLGDLTNPKHIHEYHRATTLDGYRRHAMAGSPSDAHSHFDPNVDLSPANEVRKLRLVVSGQATRCMSEMLDSTYGYHPRSQACKACELSAICLAKLQAWCEFDVMSLRTGHITRDEARASVRALQG